MRFHKHMGLLLTAAMVLTSLSPAYAANDAEMSKKIAANTELTQGMFDEKRTVPLWLLEDLKACPNMTISLETIEEDNNYRVSFTGSKIGDLPSLPRYDLTVTRVLEEKEIKKYYNAASKSTPKYLLNVSQEGDWNCEANITMLDSSFMPTSTVHAYRYTGDNAYTTVARNIEVDSDGNFTFPVTEGGIYLVTAREIDLKLPGTLDFDRPSRNDVAGLLSFLNEGSAYDFTELIESRE